MRSARRASPPRRPDPPAIPRSTLQHPTCGRLQKPPVGSQSFAHSFADLSLPPITSRATPHLGSKITIVRTANAHAWCLVWNPSSATWQDFDTTPAVWLKTEANRASLTQYLSDCWSRVMFEFAKFRWGQTHLRQYFLWALAPVLALLLYQIIFRSRRRRQPQSPAEPGATLVWPGLDSEFYQIERKLAERGARRQPSEPLSPWLRRASTDPALADMRSRLQELLNLHYRYRFEPQGLNQTDREGLRRAAAGCLAKLA